MSKPQIKINNLSYRYGKLKVLEDISMQVNAGEFLGIVGPNAGGKSTLLKLILGLLEPAKGRIEVFDKAPEDSRHRLGYVPQYPNFSRDFPISVEQAVLLGRLNHNKSGWQRWLPGRYSVSDKAIVKQALEEVEADNLINRQLGSLSGGQLQRVLLARALASEPEVLLLDEPTANIDQRLESDIFDLLKSLNDRMTILVVSHDVAFISSYVNRVACVNQTLVCHHTDAIDGDVIHNLYGEDVRMVAHKH